MGVETADRDITKLKPEFREQVELWLQECPQIFVTEVFRTKQRQKYLFDKGYSWIDGYTRKSQHQLGLAVDIAFHGDELYPTDHSQWEEVAKVARKYGIDWGYDLWAHTGFIDKPHFQDNESPFVMPPTLDEWMIEPINWAVDNEISNGERPKDNITRVEMMKMIHNYHLKFHN